MHVFGVPTALGAATAVATAAALNPDVGLALGALTAGLGSLVAGYYVTAGFDRKLVERLQAEQVDQGRMLEEREVKNAIETAEPELQPVLARLVQNHAIIDAAFADGIDDAVEAILVNSRGDLRALRDRAVALVRLHGRLRTIIGQSDPRWLDHEVRRLSAEMVHVQPGPVRDAISAAKQSTERTFAQWKAAVDKQTQIRSVLTVIESSLQEFKMAMELRKADAAMGAQTAGPEISELQARLVAAGDACDELVGGAANAQRARARRRAT